MSAAVVPDLRRTGYYAREPESLTASQLKTLWEATNYADAWPVIASRELVPALTVSECVAIFEDLGISLDRVEVVPVGTEFAWRGEVVGQFPAPGSLLEDGAPLRLFVSHPSFRLRLPDGFIGHASATGEADPGTAAALGPSSFDRFELARLEEPPAARMLRVFEAALWWGRLELCRIRSAFDGLGYDRDLAAALLEWIGVSDTGLSEDRLKWLGNYLWLLAPATGPEYDARRLLASLMEVPISIEVGVAPPTPHGADKTLRLGVCRHTLGVDAIVGSVLDERGPAVTIRIGPLATQAAAEAYRSATFGAQLMKWSRSLIPVTHAITVHYDLTAEPAMSPALGSSEAGSILGVTTFLGAPATRPAEMPNAECLELGGTALKN